MTSKPDATSLKQAGDIWKFLDAMSMANPGEYQKFIDKVMTEGKENNMGPPVAKLVIQTEKVPSVIPVRKYYINIAEWIQIPQSGDGPVTIASSDPRKEIVDKEWGYVTDILVNPQVFQKTSGNYIENAPLIEMVLKFVESKQLVSLSRKYKVLNENYAGNRDNLLNFLCPSSLKNSLDEITTKNSHASLFDQMRHIASCEEEQTDSRDQVLTHEGGENVDRNCSKNVATPNYFDPKITANKHDSFLKERDTKILRTSRKTNDNNVNEALTKPKAEMILNKNEKSLEIYIFLPNVDSVAECDLDLTESLLMLTVPGKYKLDVNFPVDINVDGSHAKFVKDERLLLVTASFL